MSIQIKDLSASVAACRAQRIRFLLHIAPISAIIAALFIVVLPVVAGQHFRIEGAIFEHHVDRTNRGRFVVETALTNALIDVLYEDGRRVTSGGDTADSFVLKVQPVDQGAIHFERASAFVSPGQFPEMAPINSQILWFCYVAEPALTNRPNRLRLEGFDGYRTDEFSVAVEYLAAASRLPAAIQWTAPGELAQGGNRLKLLNYPNGWLAYELRVLDTTNCSDLLIPSRFSFQQYYPAEPPQGGPTNVVKTPFSVEYVMESIRMVDAEADFLPRSAHTNITVTDYRFASPKPPFVYLVRSSNWVFERNDPRFAGRRLIGQTTKLGNRLVMGVLIIVVCLPAFALIGRMLVKKKNKQKIGNYDENTTTGTMRCDVCSNRFSGMRGIGVFTIGQRENMPAELYHYL